MFCRVQTGFDEDSLHGFPVVVVVGSRHAMNLPLAPDGVPVLLPRDGQEHLGAHVLEAHGILPLPVRTTALHNPEIQVIAFAIIPKGTYFLLETQASCSESVSKHLQDTQTPTTDPAEFKDNDGERRKQCCCFALSTVTEARSSKAPPNNLNTKCQQTPTCNLSKKC